MANKYVATDIDAEVLEHLENCLTGVMPDKQKEAIALVAKYLSTHFGISLRNRQGDFCSMSSSNALDTFYAKLNTGGSITPMFNRIKELAREAAEIKRPKCIEHYFNQYCPKRGIKHSDRATEIYKSLTDISSVLYYDSPSWKHNQALKDELVAIQKDLVALYGLYTVMLTY